MRLFSISRVFICRESGFTPRGEPSGRALKVHSEGTTLLETVVALAVLGAIAVTFLGGLTTTTKAAFTTDERATAESLAQSQMEWAQDASYNATGYLSAPIPGGNDYTDYSANIDAELLDSGLQKITVIVSRSGAPVITLEGYKVQR